MSDHTEGLRRWHVEMVIYGNTSPIEVEADELEIDNYGRLTFSVGPTPVFVIRRSYWAWVELLGEK